MNATLKADIQAESAIARHWRGQCELSRSFWLHAAATWALGLLLLASGIWCVTVSGSLLQLAAVLLVLLLPLWLAVSLWGGVGAWRASSRYLHHGGALMLGWGARAALVVGAVLTAAVVFIDCAPRLPGWLALAVASDSPGGLQSQLSADGQTLHWQGAIAQGDAARARAWLAAAPQLQLVELDVSGGHLHEAQLIAQAVAQTVAQVQPPRGVVVRVTGSCEDACWLVFMAGRSRQVNPQARLGFRRAAADNWWPFFGRLARAHVAARYREAGLPGPLIDQALGGLRNSTWWLDAQDLHASGVAGVPGRPWDVELPFSADAAVERYAAALATNRLWRALDARNPGSLAAAAQRMREARIAGGQGEAVQVEAQQLLRPLWGPALTQADVALREKFVAWLADGARAYAPADAATCAQFLAGDVPARRRLPQDLRSAEADWWLSVLTEPLSDRPERPLNGLEQEVARRTLGPRNIQTLAGLRPWPATAPAPCARVAALLTEVMALPVPERRLALRLVAQP